MTADSEESGNDPGRAPRGRLYFPSGGSGEPRVRILREGGTYDPAPLREKTRSRLAQGLLLLLAVVALALVVLTAVDLLSIDDAKDLGVAVFTPLVAVTGAALGFYFGGHRGSGN